MDGGFSFGGAQNNITAQNNNIIATEQLGM